ncbi:hypothetical protein QBC35DRAFT_457244 [Podospora australis]|uniref:Uncharacterized protein n=1 Tax=Podospora australis TaxID=1536484 RepID=A0AAN7ACT9_9PEZI|nr:hypothetical protein QBC35DRAFT_457244 [Podospora australis]
MSFSFSRDVEMIDAPPMAFYDVAMQHAPAHPMQPRQDHISGLIEVPRPAPHRFMQPFRSCLKPTQGFLAGGFPGFCKKVTFSAQNACVITGTTHIPTSRSREEWKQDVSLQRRLERKSRTFADKFELYAAQLAELDQPPPPKQVPAYPPDIVAIQGRFLEERLDHQHEEALANSLLNKSTCPIHGKKYRCWHPCLRDPNWDPCSVGLINPPPPSNEAPAWYITSFRRLACVDSDVVMTDAPPRAPPSEKAGPGRRNRPRKEKKNNNKNRHNRVARPANQHRHRSNDHRGVTKTNNERKRHNNHHRGARRASHRD